MVLEDETNALTIDQITTLEYQKEFKKNEQSILNLSISRSTFWLKIKIMYPDAYPNKEELTRWYLELGRSNLDVAELFVEEFDGVYEVKSSDMRSSYSDREMQHVNSIFILDISLGEELTLYARFKSTASVYMPVTLWSQVGFVEEVSTIEFIYGVFFGGMLILLLYNLFLYVSVRDVSYLYYVLYLGGITLFDFLEIGHGVIHLTNIFGDIDREYILFIIWETAVSGLLFAKSFMSIKENHPRINDFFNLLIMCSCVSAVITIFSEYDVGAFFNLLFMVIFLPSYLGVIVYCWYKGNQNAKYFFFAWVSNIVGLLIFSGVTYKVIPATQFTLAATPIGILIEAVTLSFALAHRIKNEQASVLFADNQAMNNLEKYQSVFENSREGMYTMTMEGVFLSSNPSMVRIFGFGDTKEMTLHGADLARVLFNNSGEEYSRFLQSGQSGHELFFCRRDGSHV